MFSRQHAYAISAILGLENAVFSARLWQGRKEGSGSIWVAFGLHLGVIFVLLDLKTNVFSARLWQGLWQGQKENMGSPWAG